MREQNKKEVNQDSIPGHEIVSRSSDAYQIADVLNQVHRLTAVPKAPILNAVYTDKAGSLPGSSTPLLPDPKEIVNNGYRREDVLDDRSNVSSLTDFARSLVRKQRKAA